MVVSVRLLVLSKQYCGLITGLGLPESALVYKSYRYYQKGIYSSARELKQMAPPQRDLYIEMSTAGPMDSVLQLAPWVAFFSWSNGQHSSGGIRTFRSLGLSKEDFKLDFSAKFRSENVRS